MLSFSVRFVSGNDIEQTKVLAAYSFTLSILTFVLNTLNFFVIVMMSLVSKSVGGGRSKQAEKRIQIALLGALVIGIVAFMLVAGLERPLLDLFKISSDVVRKD